MKGIKYLQFVRNMGWNYLIFRVWYELQRVSGLLLLRFPKYESIENIISVDLWRSQSTPFFFESTDELRARQFPELSKLAIDNLQKTVEAIDHDKYTLFYAQAFHMPDWTTNPINQYSYDVNLHWSKIPTMSSENGDIKYVWDKSRFCFLYHIIRYDFHARVDKSDMVLGLIQDWIRNNPVNCGPNWVCSQEIGIRLMNWIFAIQYYKHSASLNDDVFQIIVNSIYRQAEHIVDNLSFSQIAVRNNHILTESIALYTVGAMFPFFKESSQWKEMGLRIFQSEIVWQIRDDGSYLQNSFIYHRSVLQLLIWGIGLAKKNGDILEDKIYAKSIKSVEFLKSCQDPISGWMPNFGLNDGSRLFQLSDSHYRDFRPQIYVLSVLLGLGHFKNENIYCSEELKWLMSDDFLDDKKGDLISSDGWSVHRYDRYLTAKNADTLTFLHCGSDNSRPFQADQLHLDIWVGGTNILRDAGTYSYNFPGELGSYFTSTKAHNSVIVGDYDQMLKGERFIWVHWIKNATSYYFRTPDIIVLEGEFEGFKHLNLGIYHRRKVTVFLRTKKWMVEDWIEGVDMEINVYQNWHPSPSFFDLFSIEVFDEEGYKLIRQSEDGWHSETYGSVEESRTISFLFNEGYIKTIIKAK